jgi:DNA-binding response OmpR family regulator
LPPLILVVDDSSHTRELYGEYLAHVGFRVQTTGDGETALQVAGHMRPEVIVLDLSMPRLDGIAVITRLRRDRATRDIPIVMLTGHAAEAIERGVLEAGAKVFLTKPCLPEDLEAHVRQVLKRAA